MPTEVRRIGVRDLHQARAALAWAAAGHHRLLLHALEAPVLGVGFWRGVEEALGRGLVIECGAQAGAVLEALRAGLRNLQFDVAVAQAPALEALVRAHGGVCVRETAAWRLTPGRSVAGQLARLHFGEVTMASAAGTPTSERLTERSAEIQEMGLVACD